MLSALFLATFETFRCSLYYRPVISPGKQFTHCCSADCLFFYLFGVAVAAVVGFFYIFCLAGLPRFLFIRCRGGCRGRLFLYFLSRSAASFFIYSMSWWLLCRAFFYIYLPNSKPKSLGANAPLQSHFLLIFNYGQAKNAVKYYIYYIFFNMGERWHMRPCRAFGFAGWRCAAWAYMLCSQILFIRRFEPLKSGRNVELFVFLFFRICSEIQVFAENPAKSHWFFRIFSNSKPLFLSGRTPRTNLVSSFH